MALTHHRMPVTPEKAMAPHSSTLAWKIPRTEGPGRLQFMGSLRVGHGSVTSLSLFTFMYWRRKWQPTPIFLPGESQGQRRLVGSHRVGHDWSDLAEAAAAGWPREILKVPMPVSHPWTFWFNWTRSGPSSQTFKKVRSDIYSVHIFLICN